MVVHGSRDNNEQTRQHGGVERLYLKAAGLVPVQLLDWIER